MRLTSLRSYWDVHQTLNRILHGVLDPLNQSQQLSHVLLRGAQAIYGRHRGHDDDVVPDQQTRRRRVTEAVYLIVDRGVLLDIGVCLRQVGLGLVIVVIRHEVLHPVLREELPELIGELSGESLVGCKNQRRSLHLLDSSRRWWPTCPSR